MIQEKIKERIIVTPSTNKLSISLAYRNIDLFNTRFFTPVELAKEVLTRSGLTSGKDLISKDEELNYYKSIIDDTDYFKTSKLSDIRNINSSINTIRKLSVDDEDNELKNNLAKGIFKEKNDALYKVYKKYIDILDEENKIDAIGLIRYAINKANNLDSEVYILKEYSLQPLELKLIQAISDCKEISIFDLYEIKDRKDNIHIESYKNCYGTSNEVASIIDDVYANNVVDQCVVACGNYSTYLQIFYDFACKYNLNITFGNGLSLVNSYPGKLLKQYYYWISDGNFGWEPFFKLIYSPYFNFEKLKSYINFEIEDNQDEAKFWQRVSRLRLTNVLKDNIQTVNDFEKAISRDINDNDKLRKYVPSIRALADEFGLPTEDFLTKYCKTRKSNESITAFDETAITTIVDSIKSIKNIGLEITSDIIEDLLNKPIYKQTNKPKHLHICSIDSALSSLRDNLYICGLSSTTYPGSPKENPLLLDDDLKAFGNSELTSTGKIVRKKQSLQNLIDLASALNNKIYLSYPGLNVSELKNNNASSLMYEIYKKECKEDKSLDEFLKHVKKVEYFEPKLSVSRDIGNFYNKDTIIAFAQKAIEEKNDTPIELGKYSPSALNTFFDCRKKFYFQYILKISSPDPYNPYEILPANELGTLVHSLMEYLAENYMKGNRISLDEFTRFGSDVFDEYMKITVPLVKEGIKNTKDQFIEMLTNGWHMDDENRRAVAFKEEDKTTIHEESGIKIHGYPDRVEKTSDGKAVIIDFKTERDLNSHKKDDVDTCLQVLIYAYIVEKEMNLEIDHCEYRMLRFSNGIIKCKYDQDIKEQMSAKLIEFKDAIEHADYNIEPMSEKDAKKKCKYCKFGSICGRVVTKDE